MEMKSFTTEVTESTEEELNRIHQQTVFPDFPTHIGVSLVFSVFSVFSVTSVVRTGISDV